MKSVLLHKVRGQSLLNKHVQDLNDLQLHGKGLLEIAKEFLLTKDLLVLRKILASAESTSKPGLTGSCVEKSPWRQIIS